MVTKNDYISLLNSPSLLDESYIVHLESLQTKYPYCGDIQMLLTKDYHQTDNVNYQEQLKNTAISIPNREALYDLIYKVKLNEKIKEEATVSAEENIETENIKDSQELVVKDEVVEEIETKKQSINELVKTQEKSNDKLEELILSHAIGASYILEENKTDKVEGAKTEKTENKQPIKNKHHSFYSWLAPNEVEEVEEEAKNNSIDSLVEKFIQSQGSEKIKRKEFFSPTNVAKLSIVEKDDFVTETLADIYFKQHMYDKALNAYEKLILKNPEKKTYFASQIKKIKSLLE